RRPGPARPGAAGPALGRPADEPSGPTADRGAAARRPALLPRLLVPALLRSLGGRERSSLLHAPGAAERPRSRSRLGTRYRQAAPRDPLRGRGGQPAGGAGLALVAGARL